MFTRNLKAIKLKKNTKKIFSKHNFILAMTILLELLSSLSNCARLITESSATYFGLLLECVISCVINRSTNRSLVITEYVRNEFSNSIFSKTKQKIKSFYSIYFFKFFDKGHVVLAFICYSAGSCICMYIYIQDIPENPYRPQYFGKKFGTQKEGKKTI